MENQIKKDALIRLEDVTKYYTSEGGIGLGLHKVNASFNLGEFVVITGASGSGKTTLLNVITGMDSYEEGTLWINGEDTTYYGNDDYEKYRQKYISFIFQNYNLIDSFTVYKNVELALIARGITEEERKQKVIDIINEVGLGNRIKHRVTKLSGGEKQRVAIARAIASNAPIIACDEITGNLDSKTSLEIIALLRKVSAGKLVLLVSHDVNEAIEYATRVVIMHDGAIDKDYQTGVSKQLETESLSESKPIKKKELFKLALNNLFSTPRKFILLFITLYLVTGLLVALCALYDQTDTIINSLEMSSVESMSNNIENRVVVKRDDRKKFTNDDLTYFNGINTIKNVFLYDKAMDNPAYTIIDSELFYYYTLPTSLIKNTDLSYGRLPKNEDEVVISTNIKFFSDNYLNKKVKIIQYGMSDYHEFTITGVYNGNSNSIYLYDSMFDKISQSYNLFETTILFNKFNITTVSSDQIEMEKINWQIDTSLGDNDVIVQRDVFYYDESEKGTNTSDSIESSFTIKNNFVSNELIDSANITLNTVFVDANKDEQYKQDGTYDIESMYNGITKELQGATVYLSENNYQKVKDMSMDSYQATIITTSNNTESVINKLEDSNYICSSNAIVKPMDTLQIVIMFVKGYFIFYVGLMFIGISAIVYAIIKNVIKTQQRNFLIMRSLGIDGKKIEFQVFVELLFSTLIAYASIFLIWFVCQFRKLPSFLGALHDMSFGLMAFVFVIMMLLMSLLAYRYTVVVVKSTIVNKDME